MKFSSSVSAALIAATSFATFTLAAPLSSNTIVARKYDNSTATYPSNTTTTAPATTATAAATWTGVPANALPSAPLMTSVPDKLATFNIGLGKIQAWYPGHPWISTKSTNGGQDITTLASFIIPDAYSANTCELVFDLYGTDAWTYADGTQIGNIFTSLYPAKLDATNNGRDRSIGQFKVEEGKRVYGYNKAIKFPCAAATNGKMWNIEMVPNGEIDRISWDSSIDGLKVLVHAAKWQY